MYCTAAKDVNLRRRWLFEKNDLSFDYNDSIELVTYILL